MSTDLETIYETAGSDGADAEVPERSRWCVVIVLDRWFDVAAETEEPIPAWFEFSVCVLGLASLVWLCWMFLW